jgi:hypothetical protein
MISLSVCMYIYTFLHIHIDIHSYFQDDSIRSKLIHLCLAFKNGLHVSASEAIQVLRRAYALNLHLDPTMGDYLKVFHSCTIAISL